MGRRNSHKVSYIRNLLAKHSIPAVILAGAALILTGAGVWLSVMGRGEAGLNAAACGACAILVSITGMLYCWRSSVEKEKNYILAKAGMILCGLILLFWVCLIIAGIM